jgi:hypothetical protein
MLVVVLAALSYDVSHSRAAKSITCRIYRESTIHSMESNAWDEEQLLCSPILEDFETDAAFKISLPAKLQQQNSASIKDGTFILRVPGGTIERDSIVGFRESELEGVHSEHPRILKMRELANAVEGTRTILVLRVSVQDAAPDFTAAEFGERIFGYTGLTVQSQYEQCSAGKLSFQPAPFGNNGVLDVQIESVISDMTSRTELSNVAIETAANILDLSADQHISSLVNHVMICLPPGTGSWVASAATNHWRSLYNNKFCGILSASMHEIGYVL